MIDSEKWKMMSGMAMGYAGAAFLAMTGKAVLTSAEAVADVAVMAVTVGLEAAFIAGSAASRLWANPSDD